jgi:hypothetical protein
MVDETKLFAWLDGELDAAEAAAVEAEVAADPRLARMAEQHRALGARLRGAFDTVAAAPVPERLQAAAKPPRGNVIDFGSRRDRRNWLPLPQWAAMAATLVLGIGIGTTLIGERGASPVEMRGGKMIAAAGLDQALDKQLASAGTAGGVRVGLTFRDQAGTICRSFTGERSSGLACRDGGDWQVRGLFAAPEGQRGDYRMAVGADPNLAALIDSTIAGDAFDAEQEKTARERGWR